MASMDMLEFFKFASAKNVTGTFPKSWWEAQGYMQGKWGFHAMSGLLKSTLGVVHMLLGVRERIMWCAMERTKRVARDRTFVGVDTDEHLRCAPRRMVRRELRDVVDDHGDP